MQTTADNTASTSKAIAGPRLCIDCAHHIDLGRVGLPRICVLPDNTGTDPVAGGPAWLPCSQARATENACCGPQGLAFKPRASQAAQQAPRPQRWWSSIRDVFFPLTCAVQPVDLAKNASVQIAQVPVNQQTATTTRFAVQSNLLRSPFKAIGRDALIDESHIAGRAEKLHDAREA
jgi:hypothetical protein